MDAEILAVCDLLRLAEPTDHLLKAATLVLGAEHTRNLITNTGATHLRPLYQVAEEAGLEIRGEDIAKARARWATRLGEIDAHRDIRIMSKLGARLITPQSSEWSSLLGSLVLDEPLGLWVRGPGHFATLARSAVAVVGARAASTYGVHCARTFAHHLVARGHTVSSGGAFGIDAAAHQAALGSADSAEVGTLAFMAGGVDTFYPRGNSALLSDIAEQYLVVSEAPPGASAMRHRFLLRNRLIAAASVLTLVVQAGFRSGAINTAYTAAHLGRPVAAIPGLITAADQAGCHRLIRDGVSTLVTSVDDVSELIGGFNPEQGELNAQAQSRASPVDGLSTNELQVYSALSATHKYLPAEIAQRAGLDPRTTRACLGALVLKNMAAQTTQGWVKVRQ